MRPNLTLLVFLACVLIPVFVPAKTLVVCPDCELRDLHAALAKSQDGDEILIRKGIYEGHGYRIAKKIRIIGEDFPVLDGRGEGGILLVASDSVSIEGLVIRNTGISYTEDRAGIRLRNVKGCSIIGNRVENTLFGIHLEQVWDCRVEDNRIEGVLTEYEASSGNAIHLWYCKRVTIRNNFATGHRDGIYFEFVDNSLIENNVSEGNLRYGLHFMFSNDDEYYRNVFRGNGAGVAVMFSDHITMQYNLFEKNWGPASYGLLLKEIKDSRILQNQFIQNTIGIFAESAIRVIIQDNEFEQNGWALRILGSCTDDSITNNNFVANTFDLATNRGRNHNLYQHNFWHNYAGYDLDRDGCGDVPYRPVSLYSYIVTLTPASIILLRSLVVDLLNFAEKIVPSLTPDALLDSEPQMKRIPLITGPQA